MSLSEEAKNDHLVSHINTSNTEPENKEIELTSTTVHYIVEELMKKKQEVTNAHFKNLELKGNDFMISNELKDTVQEMKRIQCEIDHLSDTRNLQEIIISNSGIVLVKIGEISSALTSILDDINLNASAMEARDKVQDLKATNNKTVNLPVSLNKYATST